tara:strand:- start:163 stop:2256 length:2094 start_codon:yes stop_codon:yes gene_type:complete
MSRLKGYIFNNAGTAVEGATVTALEAGTTTAIGSTVESGSDGSWSFTSGLTGKNVDVKIESGSTVRYLKHDDHVQVEHMWVRSDTGNTVAPMRIENATNNASNLLLELVGDNSTRADGDEIYISFKMDDDGGNEHEFARITADATDVSNGNEDGQLRFGVSVAGTMTDVFTINATTAGVSDMTLDVSGDLTLDADGGDVFFKDGGTTFGSATNNSGNLIIKSGTTTALTFTGADVAVAGDLTISGDDLKMATNTDAYILVADGTSYNPVAISGDATISNAGAITIANDAVESGMLNDNVISGQTEITSGLVAADEFLYSDGGTIKRVGIDTLATKMLGLASTGAVAQASDHMVFLDGSATGDVIVESIGDFLSAIAGSGISVSSNQLTASATDTVDMGDGFVIEDGDGTEVTITENKEVKFVEGNGIDIDWTDTDNGTDGDPYDLTFTVDHDAATNFVAAEHYDWSSDVSGTATIHANNVTDLHGAGVSGSNNQLLTDDGDGTVTSESNLTFDGTDLTIATGSIQVRTIDYSDGDNAITIADGGGVTFAQDITVADSKGIIIDSTPTDNGFNGIFASFDNATGATINQGEVVYVTGTANQVAKAQANADNTMPAIAIATADVANGASGNFMLHGIVHDSSKFPTLTIGGEVYVSEDTAGLITSTLPASSGDRVQVIGIGLHGDKMLFNPSYDIVERG